MPLSKRERIQAALAFQEVDRPPYSVWTHYPVADLQADELVRLQARDARRYAFDFVKTPNNGLFMVLDYGTEYAKDARGAPAPDKYGSLVVAQYAVDDSRKWETLVPLDPEKGCLGDQLRIVCGLKKALAADTADDAPIVQTIYSPLTTAYKLAGDLLLKDMRERPALVHAALEAITETTRRFAAKSLERGAEGFFFASQLSNHTLVDDATYDAFGERYDREVFAAFAGRTFFDIVHIHGENAMFSRLAGYPANCVSWHDRWIGPSLADARQRTSKCLLGGIDEENAFGVIDDASFGEHVRQALDMGGKTGFILGPGCTAYPNMPETHLRIILHELRARSFCPFCPSRP